MRRILLGCCFSAVFSLSACSDDGPTDTGTSIPDAAVADSARPDAQDPDTGGGADVPVADAGPNFTRFSCADVTGTCVQVEADDSAGLFVALNTLEDNTTVVLGAGTFDLNNAATIRNADHITLTGQGIDSTILSFASQPAQANGVDVVGDDFTISHLTVTDAKKDGLRIENSTNVWIHHVKVTWSGGPMTSNGSYGIYPVRSTNVLMEDSEAYNASDAGLYVGQCINVIVRRNIAKDNVAGLEIENTQFAEVYENLVESNAGGLLVFDLPGNPVIGRDISIHHNTVVRNNRPNFAPSGTTVSSIPAGTGTFALASRRVEIRNNTYDTNNTTAISLLSGLVISSSTTAWAIPIDQVVGSTVGLNLINTGSAILNFRSDEIWVHNNTYMTNGRDADDTSPTLRPLGVLLAVVYLGEDHVDEILYDGIGERVDPMTPANNTNVNHICVEEPAGAGMAVLDLPRLQAIADGGGQPVLSDIYRPAEPFAPFNCTGFTGGPIAPVDLPFGD